MINNFKESYLIKKILAFGRSLVLLLARSIRVAKNLINPRKTLINPKKLDNEIRSLLESPEFIKHLRIVELELAKKKASRLNNVAKKFIVEFEKLLFKRSEEITFTTLEQDCELLAIKLLQESKEDEKLKDQKEAMENWTKAWEEDWYKEWEEAWYKEWEEAWYKDK